MSTVYFLRVGGAVLLLLGGLGVVRLLERISSRGLFNPPRWINWVHLGAGAAVLTLSFSTERRWQNGVTLFAATVGLALGLVGLTLGRWIARRPGISDTVRREFSEPSDHLAHLTVGVAALGAWLLR